MLSEIVCDKFKVKKVSFKSGLNTVLGTNEGDNSIGKSSFLLIVDFAFGGSTYAESEDILKNVGEHEINFAFKFDDEMYYFCRGITTPKTVYVCDDQYNKVDSLTTEQYCKWLDEKYSFQVPYSTFRKQISRYIRVYGKNNSNEKLPLHGHSRETMNEAVCELLKIFNYYEPIKQILDVSNDSKNKLNAYKDAQKYKFVTSITKKEYGKNINEIKNIDIELNDLANNLKRGLIDKEAAVSEEAIEIKNKLSRARRMKGKSKVKVDRYNKNYEYEFSPVTSDFDSLVDFFPNINIKRIEEIELFHKNISKIFKKEVKKEQQKLEAEIEEYDKLIDGFEKRLQELNINPNLSETVLRRYSELKNRKDELESKNNSYDKLQELKNNKSVDDKRATSVKENQLSILSKKINVEMNRLNKIIYNDENNSPILSFSKNNYSFITPDNTGTGIAYKGLVIFDISVLNLTNLPIVVHDSIILKQISDSAIEKILELYIKSGKQVIVSLDKQDTYTEKARKILNESAILHLGIDGNELYGKSWG